MGFVSIHHLDGDPEELLARKREHFDTVVDRLAPEHGAILSVTARTDRGLLVVNVWDSAEGAAEFTARPEVQQAAAAAALPPPSSFERYAEAEITRYR